MKTIQNILAAGLISAFLFTSCTKDNSPEANMPGAADQAATGNMAAVTYEVQTKLPSSGIVTWDKGYMSLSDFTFSGNHLVSNSIRQDKFSGGDGITVGMPGSYVAGSVNVPMFTYVGISSSLQLNPVNSYAAFFISGTTRRGDEYKLPVQILINQPVGLSSQWMENVVVNQGNYTAILTLDLSTLMNGITQNMLDLAAETNGMILISQTSNPNLYAMVVSNLESNQLNMQLIAVNGNNNTTTVNTGSTPAPTAE